MLSIVAKTRKTYATPCARARWMGCCRLVTTRSASKVLQDHESRPHHANFRRSRMIYQCIDFTITDKIAHLVLNRPAALNTMQPVLWHELGEVVQALQRVASARVLVISSTGKHFTAGMALDVFGSDA